MRTSARDAVASRVLDWFAERKRDLPWRRTRDPYRILVAEFLLQRTRVASGLGFYARFLARFPDVRTLASAPEEDVLRAWEGLGYYRRARHLHAAARVIVDRHGGRVPSNYDDLRSLPGVGPYTAGAVASIAFGERVPAVDGNAIRVLARLHGFQEDVTRGPARERLVHLAANLVPESAPGAFNQALMEIGSTVCTPRAPRCTVCPIEDLCVARAEGIQERLPRGPRAARPRRVAVAFAVVRAGGKTLLVRRPDRGLLGGLWSLPGGETQGRRSADGLRKLVREQTGMRVSVRGTAGRVDRVFSHRRWSGPVYACVANGGTLSAGARWVSPKEARRLPVVPFMRSWLEDPTAA